jgi:hypothetical protein
LAEVERKAETDALEDVQLSLGRLRISPLKAITPEESDTALAPLYAHLPAIRITDLLAEVDRWTGFSQCFTHLQSGRAADEPRAILTAVLADATNLGHTRMAEACNLVTQRQLGWLASWHLREETYGRALARLVDAQHTAPLAALFGSGTSSSSDGQNFPLDRRAQATGAVNPHKGTEPAVSFTATSRIATRRSIPQLSPLRRARRHRCSTGCSTTAPICTSKSITSMAGASPTMCSRYVICLGSGSRRVSRISPHAVCTCLTASNPAPILRRWSRAASTKV